MKKTHWKAQDNPMYLGAYSLMGSDSDEVTAIIEKVVGEVVKTAKGAETCRVVYLKGHKPMILNTTNSKIIEKMYDTPFIEDWVGKSITIYVAKIKAFGEMMDALRIRSVEPVIKLPELTPNTENWANVIQALTNGYTIDQIKGKYSLSKTNETKLKNELAKTI